MNIFKKLLPLSLALLVVGMVSIRAVPNATCSYDVQIENKSGGHAILQKADKKVAGMQVKQVIPNNNSRRLVVKELGAHVTFKVGPEGEAKTEVRIPFYDATDIQPRVILEKKKFTAQGFNTKPGKTYNLTINNYSGGNATIVSDRGVSMKNGNTLADGMTSMLTVHAGGWATFKTGPEGNKRSYKVMFCGQQRGKNPSITLGRGSMFSSGVTSIGFKVQVQNAEQKRLSTGLGPKREQKPAPVTAARAQVAQDAKKAKSTQATQPMKKQVKADTKKTADNYRPCRDC